MRRIGEVEKAKCVSWFGPEGASRLEAKHGHADVCCGSSVGFWSLQETSASILVVRSPKPYHHNPRQKSCT